MTPNQLVILPWKYGRRICVCPEIQQFPSISIPGGRTTRCLQQTLIKVPAQQRSSRADKASVHLCRSKHSGKITGCIFITAPSLWTCSARAEMIFAPLPSLPCAVQALSHVPPNLVWKPWKKKIGATEITRHGASLNSLYDETSMGRVVIYSHIPGLLPTSQFSGSVINHLKSLNPLCIYDCIKGNKVHVE